MKIKLLYYILLLSVTIPLYAETLFSDQFSFTTQDEESYQTVSTEYSLDSSLNPFIQDNAAVESNYLASGYIKDAAGNPIADVTVRMGNKTATSGANGYWEMGGLVEGVHTVTFNKDGMTFTEQAFELGNGVNAELNAMPINSLKLQVKTVQHGIISQGSNLNYVITVINGGQTPATNVVLTENIPTDAKIAALQTDTGHCDLNTATCQLPDLAPGASATVQLELSNLPSSGATFSNTISVVSKEYPVDVVKTWHKVKPYLSLLGKSIPNPVEMNKTLHYQLSAELLSTAPELTATDVKAEITLPTEVKFLQAVATQGNCENVSNKVTCALGNLSIENSDSISGVDIAIDVELIDPGLLQLNAETKISAANYPEHHEVIRTALYLADVQVDGAILLDITGSMGEELEAVKRAIKNKLAEQYNGAKPLIALVSFRDAVKFEAASTDLNVLLQVLEKLQASGGGLCEEASAEALELALAHLKPNGTVIFISDAPPYPGTDIEKLKARIIEKQANFIPILTKSDCAPNALTQ